MFMILYKCLWFANVCETSTIHTSSHILHWEMLMNVFESLWSTFTYVRPDYDISDTNVLEAHPHTYVQRYEMFMILYKCLWYSRYKCLWDIYIHTSSDTSDEQRLITLNPARAVQPFNVLQRNFFSFLIKLLLLNSIWIWCSTLQRPAK